MRLSIRVFPLVLLALAACGGGGGGSNPVAIVTSGWHYEFFDATPALTDVSNQVTDFEVTDLNGDGHLDTVAAHSGNGTVAVALGNGDGTFDPAIEYPLGTTVSQIAVADINGDDRPEIFGALYTQGALGILVNAGDGTFGAPSTVATGDKAAAVVVGDFNGDQKVDVVVGNEWTDTLSFLAGTGSGLLAPVSSPGENSMARLEAAFVDGDANLDLLVVTYTPTVSAMLGDGTGHFTLKPPQLTANIAVALDSGDLDEDGFVDVVVAARDSNQILVYFGNGDGTLDPALILPYPGAPTEPLVADLNGDSHLDVAFPLLDLDELVVLPGVGDGTFFPDETYVVGNKPYRLHAGDFFEDGNLDLVIGVYEPAGIECLIGEPLP